MSQLIILSDSQIIKAKEFYEQERSLRKTAVWVAHGCQNDKGELTEPEVQITRHPLRRIFLENDIPIRKPNGTQHKPMSKPLNNSMDSPLKAFALRVVRLTIQDILKPDETNPEHFLSACWFILEGDLYKDCADLLGINHIPKHLNDEMILLGRDLYYALFCRPENRLPFHYKAPLLAYMRGAGIKI